MPARGPAPHPTASQTDVVIEGIKQMILSGELGPGSRLPVEKDLAARLGVSRGPLREGVRALVLLGVLGTRRGDGTYVTSLDAGRLLEPVGFLADLPGRDDAVHLARVRRVLEVEGVGRAAVEIDDATLAELRALLDSVDALLDDPDHDLTTIIDADLRFHDVIHRASGNPVLAGLLDSLAGSTARTRLWRAIREDGAVRTAQAEHRAILAALEARDVDRARIHMAAHLLSAEEYAASLL